MLALDKVSKFYGGRTIFESVSWAMADDARVGLVGLNGAGKTTLLRMIGEVIAPDAGRIARPQRSSVGYLPQDAPEMGGRPALEETLSALSEMLEFDRRRVELEEILAKHHSGPEHEAALAELGDVLSELERHGFYEADSRAKAVLFGLGFSEADLARDVAEFSGGIRMRIALAKLLVRRPEFLMLDEPTNHLDLEARNWLEDYLSNYPGGIILVSHDRYFLDRVTDRTVEVSRGRLVEYRGGYSAYLVEREQRRELEQAAYENQRAEIEHMETFISRFRYQASKAKLVQSRIKQLEKIERLEPPAGSENPPAIRFPQCERGGRRVFELRGAVKRYGDITVYDGVDLTIERGARIALVGPNGAGKSTMMKLLAGIEPMTAGQRTVGAGIEIGYFAQNLAESLDYGKTALKELSDAAEGMTTGEIRGLLGAMLFSGDDALKPAGVLSGGERARLALAKVLAHRNNCLLLDEPTNNLDIVAKDTLLEALRRFPGTVVIVSHDRYLLNELATEVIEVGQGHATRYLGNYDYYLAKKAAAESAAVAANGAAARAAASAAAAERAAGLRAASGAEPGASGARTAIGARSANGASAGNGGRTAGAQRATAPSAPGKAGADGAAAHDNEIRQRRERERRARRRQTLEGDIGRKETERAALGEQMNDPNFYLQRTDAKELIAAYERLGGEIERLYEELMSLDGGAAPSGS
ncbi:MAG TPA: ABC-F family ATP-binding cassette domain-containing protein [Candidatus Binataceae bacterium]|nr:ABC-F family ATP-binding cassette domain-containing protein [Candidatus Binataceae bacterium]